MVFCTYHFYNCSFYILLFQVGFFLLIQIIIVRLPCKTIIKEQSLKNLFKLTYRTLVHVVGASDGPDLIPWNGFAQPTTGVSCVKFSDMQNENSNATFYRNKNDFIINENESVDAGSLWERNGSKLVLVDDDNFIETDFDNSLFEKSK